MSNECLSGKFTFLMFYQKRSKLLYIISCSIITSMCDRWRYLYIKVKQEIKKAKKTIAKNIEETSINSAKISRFEKSNWW